MPGDKGGVGGSGGGRGGGGGGRGSGGSKEGSGGGGGGRGGGGSKEGSGGGGGRGGGGSKEGSGGGGGRGGGGSKEGSGGGGGRGGGGSKEGRGGGGRGRGGGGSKEGSGGGGGGRGGGGSKEGSGGGGGGRGGGGSKEGSGGGGGGGGRGGGGSREGSGGGGGRGRGGGGSKEGSGGGGGGRGGGGSKEGSGGGGGGRGGGRGGGTGGKGSSSKQGGSSARPASASSRGSSASTRGGGKESGSSSGASAKSGQSGSGSHAVSGATKPTSKKGQAEEGQSSSRARPASAAKKDSKPDDLPRKLASLHLDGASAAPAGAKKSAAKPVGKDSTASASTQKPRPTSGKAQSQPACSGSKPTAKPATEARQASASGGSSTARGSPLFDIGEAIRTADCIMSELNVKGAANPKQDVDKFFDDEVKLMRKEKDQAGDEFIRLRQIMTDTLKEMTPCTWSFLNSGSHYDGVKVTRADEMDCMFFPDNVPSNWLYMSQRDTPPEFCYIQLKASKEAQSDPKYQWLKELCDGERLSSVKYRDKIFSIFNEGLKKHRHAEDADRSSDCPSFKVVLNVVPGSDGRRGLRAISVDFLPALKLDGWPSASQKCLDCLNKDDADMIRKTGYHVIPKFCRDSSYSQSQKKLMWRLSFSYAEKYLTLHADGRLQNPDDMPTCRKLVMRMLKRMLEIFREMNNSPGWKEPNRNFVILRDAVAKLKKKKKVEVEKFTSFQIRTLMWTKYFVNNKPQSHWANTERRGRLRDALNSVLRLLSGSESLTHFFVPRLDIMKDVPEDEREFLYILFYIAKELF